MISTIIAFIVVLSVLILVHELGHFVTAKRAGVRVEEFGLGYPPRVFGIKRGETTYSINLLPFGGFVKIHGENGRDGANKSKRAFYNQPIAVRALILSAGVLMNIVLAMVLLSVGHWFGLPAVVEDGASGYATAPKVQILEVAPDSPAEKAGITVGDTIKEIQVDEETTAISSVDEAMDVIGGHKGEEIALTLERGSEIVTVWARPRVNYAANEGSLGVALVETAIIRYPWYLAIYKGVTDTIYLTGAILLALINLLKELVTEGRVAANIAGPVGIFNLTGQVVKLGFIHVLQFTALFSINLAIINIWPLPALDGGRLMFLLIEKIKGSPVSQKVERWTHAVGFILIIFLMLAITWKDIAAMF